MADGGEAVMTEQWNHLTDTELIHLFRSGEQLAFQQLALRYLFLIRSKAADLGGKGVESDDLVQEGFLALLSAAETYEENGGAVFRTYAAACIKNRLVSAVRSANSRKNQWNASAWRLEEDVPVHENVQPENALIIKEDFARLIAYMETSLSPSELRVLSLYLEGHSYDEIARTLGISRKSCDNAMQRVRKKLKDLPV